MINKILSACLLFSLMSVSLFSQITIYSEGTIGDWDDPTMWNLNRVPNINDVVKISGEIINIDGINVTVKELRVNNDENENTVLNIINGGILSVTTTLSGENKNPSDVEVNVSNNSQLLVQDLLFNKTYQSNNSNLLRLRASDGAYINVSNDFTWSLGISMVETGTEIVIRDSAQILVNQNTNFNIYGGHDLDIRVIEKAKFTCLNNLVINKSGGSAFNLTLDTGTPLFTVGSLNVNQSGGTANSLFSVQAGTFEVNGVTYISNTQDIFNVEFLSYGADSKFEFKDDISFLASSENDILYTIQNKSKLFLGGNITRTNGFGNLVMDANATIVFNGSGIQTIPTKDGAGTDSFSFGKLEFRNTSGQMIELVEDMIIETELLLTQGVINSKSENMVIFAENATVVGGSEDNYISGPIKKIGLGANQEFTFPSGHLGKYAPMTIYSTVKAAGEFTARFINCPPPYGNVDPTQTPIPLDHVSELERWTLERSAGSDDVDVRLHWNNATTAGISDTTSLVVAMYDGTNWVNIGRSEPMGSAAAGQAGSIKNAINCPPPYGMTEFTFGSTTQQQNLLPVVMTSFGGSQNDNSVNLNWVTSQEINTDQFIVESSIDGLNFSRISQIEAQGNSNIKHHYFSTDTNPIIGTNYYRLRQMDLNGMYTLSDIVGVEYNEIIQVGIFPNPVTDFINLKGNFPNANDNLIQVFDQVGRLIHNGIFISSQGIIQIQTEALNIKGSGMYYFKLNIGNVKETIQVYISK